MTDGWGRSSKVLLIGQGPSGTSWKENMAYGKKKLGLDEPEDYAVLMGRREALTGRSGAFLARLAGMTMKRYLLAFDRVNVLDRYRGKDGKGDAFPAKEAEESASRIHLGGRTVLFMGRKVAEAFGLGGAKYLVWYVLRGGVCAVFPHPSGVNLWWNDAENRKRASEFLRRVSGPRRY